MSDVLVARQPIYDRELHVAGYELIYRREREDSAGDISEEQATSRLLLDTFMDLGLGALVRDKPAFVHFATPHLTRGAPFHTPIGKVVVEVDREMAQQPDALSNLQELISCGYRVALDDFGFQARFEPFLNIAHYVRFDLLGPRRSRIIDDVKHLRPLNTILVAYQVDTQEDYQFCKDLGFDQFQGRFLCQPRLMKKARPPSNRVATLRLLTALENPASDAQDLEQIIGNDVTLSYRLLRYVNSAFFGLRKNIDSIQRALVYLGAKNVRTWAKVIVLSQVDDKPSELIHIALQRGRMCELLGQMDHPEKAAACFTVGLFSVLDALLDLPMTEALEPLPLATEIEQALLNHQGIPGQALACVRAYHEGVWKNVDGASWDNTTVRSAYLDAAEWSNEVSAQLMAA